METARNIKAAMAASRNERLAAMNSRIAELTKKRQDMTKHMNFYHKSILRGNPSASSMTVCSGFKGIEGSS